MNKDEVEKEMTTILYRHTDQNNGTIREVDYEEVIADAVKSFAIPCVVGSSTKKVNGYVGMNSNEFDIENMTFHKNKKRATDYWGSKQDIVKVEVKFFL